VSEAKKPLSGLDVVLYVVLGIGATVTGTCVACTACFGSAYQQAKDEQAVAAAARVEREATEEQEKAAKRAAETQARAAMLAAARADAEQKRVWNSVEADAIAAAYDSNEIAGDAAYKGKWTIINGRADDVGKDLTNNAYVAFAHKPQRILGRVQCFFAPEYVADAAKLSKGAYARVVGMGDGKFGNVIFRDCMVIP
jgi:ferredoxin